MRDLNHEPHTQRDGRARDNRIVLSDMTATLRTSTIRRRRQRRDKRQKLRGRLAHATAAERPALEAKLLKTYPLPAAKPHDEAHSVGRPAGA